LIGLTLNYIFRKWKRESVSIGNPVAKYLLAAFLVLLFSMCIPFEWGLQFLTDLIPPLKQFRALGRFSWVFYYVVGVSAACSVFMIFSQLVKVGNGSFAKTLLVVALGVWAIDSSAYFLSHTTSSWPPNQKLVNHSAKYLERFASSEVDPDDFQAIMSLPLISIRTDKMVFGDNFDGYNEAMSCGFHTGLPIIQSSTSRPSFSQSFSNIQLISDEHIHKTRLHDMDDRPLLLIVSKTASLMPGEQRLVDRASWFWENSEHQFLSLPISAFNADPLPVVLSDFPTETSEGSRIFQSSPAKIVYHGYDNLKAETSFCGAGALFAKKGPIELFSGSIQYDSALAEASFWLFIDPSYDGMPVLEYSHGNTETDFKSRKIDVRHKPDIIGDWLRVDITLAQDSMHNLKMWGHNITIDEFLIRPKSINVRVQHDGDVDLINNFPVPEEK
ncbi:MAG: hypothetical protein OEQ53_20120, partial [Saprospiraceae bacterium]|nr:hypothetical protein [Saprospiraceae bacterium]